MKIDKMNYTGNFLRADWVKNTNVYEVNIRQYTAEGTFNAFAKELPRLKEMGVETLWLMPITPIAEKGKKGILGSPYACSSYTTINPEFGSLEDFVNLVKHAQGLGFKFIIDWVANHTGWDHVWTVEHPDYFLIDSATNDFKAASGMEDIIELNYSNPELRQAMIDAMAYWVDVAGIDGFRCDLASWVQLDFWVEARTILQKKFNPLFWLGEFDPIDNPNYMNVFDSAYSWTWMHKTEEFYKHNLSLDVLKGLLYSYDTEGGGSKAIKLWFTSNHDENSWNGTEYEKYGSAAKLFAVFSFTWDGIPLIYSGQELPNHKRLAFFEKDQIEWSDNYGMSQFYKTLTSLKNSNQALLTSDENVKTYFLSTDNADSHLLAYLRKNGESEVAVFLNFSNEHLKFAVTDSDLFEGKYKNVFYEAAADFNENKQLEMSPWQYLVFEK